MLRSRQTVLGFRRLTPFPSQNAARCLVVGFGATRAEEFGGLHSGDLLGDRRRDELIDTRAVFLADLRDGCFQRRGQPQRVGYRMFLHDVILRIIVPSIRLGSCQSDWQRQ